MGNSPHSAPIHILDDDSLLNVFYFCRPFLFGEDEDEDARLTGGSASWIHGRWWYRLVHVCQRWRNIVFGSPSYLALSLVCTYGTPVADMLAHSPHLPLVIDYFDEDRDFTAEDGNGAILALKQRDRVRGVRLCVPAISLQGLIVAIDEEYSNLEYLIIHRQIGDSRVLEFLKTLQVPHLRHLSLVGFALPIQSRLLTTAVRLITLCVVMISPSTYFRPNTLLQWLSNMPQLERLGIGFFNSIAQGVPGPSIYKHLTDTPIATPVTLPNLHRFKFRGDVPFMEALVPQITTPCLDELVMIFSKQLTFSVPHLVQFINTTETLRFDSAKILFCNGRADMKLYSRGEDEMYALSITVECSRPTWQVSSMAQISNALGQVFSAVKHLELELEEVHTPSSEGHADVDPTEWCRFLRSFNNVKTLDIAERLVELVSRFLDDGGVAFRLHPLPNP